jgi:hypothetical protein
VAVVIELARLVGLLKFPKTLFFDFPV